VQRAFGAGFGSLGPVIASAPGPLTIVADRAVAAMPAFTCGANEDGYHLIGVNLVRDVPGALVADIRNVVAGDPSPDGGGPLEICRGVEVGHVFQLGTKYSAAMNATFLDAAGETRLLEMGCYGIGVSRIVAAAIEQNFDDRGIVWPAPLAPFDVAIVPIALRKSALVRDTVEALYGGLTAAGIEVLLDDRDERPGVMFADMELIGIPHRIVVGDRGLKQSQIEYQRRGDSTAEQIALDRAVEIVRSRVCAD
jgi:prolyl-tRNA synthetase